MDIFCKIIILISLTMRVFQYSPLTEKLISEVLSDCNNDSSNTNDTDDCSLKFLTLFEDLDDEQHQFPMDLSKRHNSQQHDVENDDDDYNDIYCNNCFRSAKKNKDINKLIESQTKSFCRKLKNKMVLKNTKSYLRNTKIKPQPYSSKIRHHFQSELQKLFDIYDEAYFTCKCNFNSIK
jgi:hypothetical protein